MTYNQKPSREEVERILRATDWASHWQRVAETCEPQIDAYRRASALSRAKAREHVFI